MIATGQRCKTAAATGCPPRRLSLFTVNAHCRAQRSKTVAVKMAGLLREWLTRARRDKAAGRMPVPAATDGAYTANCFFCKDISQAGASGATRWPAARCKNTCFALQYSPFHRPERCIPNDNTGRSAGGQGTLTMPKFTSHFSYSFTAIVYILEHPLLNDFTALEKCP